MMDNVIPKFLKGGFTLGGGGTLVLPSVFIFEDVLLIY